MCKCSRNQRGFFAASLCKTHTSLPVKIVPGKKRYETSGEQRIVGGERQMERGDRSSPRWERRCCQANRFQSAAPSQGV